MISDTHRWVLGGGLASGKSEVGEILGERGILVIDADAVGHEMLEPGAPAHPAVAAAWPQVVSEGRIQRAALAAIVFAKEAELKRLESMTHPHIFGTISRRIEAFEGVVVVEVPVIYHRFDAGWGRIVVDAEDEVRLSRAMSRGLTSEDAEARMRSQPGRGEWLAAGDIVVPNHGSLDELRTTVGHLVPIL